MYQSSVPHHAVYPSLRTFHGGVWIPLRSRILTPFAAAAPFLLLFASLFPAPPRALQVHRGEVDKERVDEWFAQQSEGPGGGFQQQDAEECWSTLVSAMAGRMQLPAAAAVDDQMMFGPDYLVAPQLREQASARAHEQPVGPFW